MAAAETVTKVSLAILLNNGTTTTGQVKTASVSLPKVKTTYDKTTDDAKFLAIANALAPCFDLMVHATRRVITAQVYDDE